jgi:hypothetical protein
MGMKMLKLNYEKSLKLILWLIALHSFCFGIALIVLPISVIEFFGFRLIEKFFAIQGGVFHIVVSLAYIMAAMDLRNALKLIILSCTAKFMATIFLLTWFFFGSHIFMVIFSGIADFLMGIAILSLYLMYRKSLELTSETV